MTHEVGNANVDITDCICAAVMEVPKSKASPKLCVSVAIDIFFRSTSESRPNSIEGKNVRTSVRPSVHKKFLQFE